MTGLLATAALAGCSSAEDRAESDAATKASQVGEAAHGTFNPVQTAEEIGRRVTGRDDATLLAVAGSDTGTKQGVTITIKVVGVADAGWWEPDREDGPAYEFCYDVRITRYEAHKPKQVPCPAVAPMTYPPLAPEPKLPDPESLQQSFAKATDEAGVREILSKLALDQRVRVDVLVRDGYVGVALRADRTFGHSYDCRLIRIAPVKTEAWRPATVYLQPGELSCTAGEAIGGAGMRPPH
ncbi:hypothetical protein HDA40_001731 [Hamadaea flava]|uniref:Translation initiation factor IF-2 n=1 Tax=Hamadaea flava TaxID=1742688 RepID=A0ABV8LPG1_9ACTN|nr:hypothetical protein [Hamadaea flava]MCP2323224.1 hypothetical protein [Hamadaea flava]